MTDYSALVAKWATLTGTTDQKLAAINALQVTLPPIKAIVTPAQIQNAVDYAALQAVILSPKGGSLLSAYLSGSSIDASAGSNIRQGLHDLFAASHASLAGLASLFAPFDNPQTPWYLAPIEQGGGGLGHPVSSTDLVNAGGLV